MRLFKRKPDPLAEAERQLQAAADELAAYFREQDERRGSVIYFELPPIASSGESREASPADPV